MAKRNTKSKKRKRKFKAKALEGAEMLRRVFPLLQPLAGCGTARDRAGNRKLLFSHYAGLMLVGMFNPILDSARGLVAASGLKRVREFTGGSKVSISSFSEASTVFDPELLEGLLGELQTEVQTRSHIRGCLDGRTKDQIPNNLVERLIAVDGSILTALPQVVGRLNGQRGQWRLHAQVRVLDRTAVKADLTTEPSTGVDSERNVFKASIEASGPAKQGDLYLMDRGYRSAELFNTLHDHGHDYICRLNRKDGRKVTSPEKSLPELSDAAREQGIVSDELITLGGGSGASPVGTTHRLRRIKLIPPADRASVARQGRLRTDQSGRDELILATTLVDLPAEQIVMLYEYRWQVELFFRFLKQVLRCNKLLSAKTEGVQIQLYCALIASLLIALVTGNNVTKRHFEMICLFYSGWADEEELEEMLESLNQKPP